MSISKIDLQEAIIDKLTITLRNNSAELSKWVVINDHVLNIIECSYYEGRDKYYMDLDGIVKECTPSSYVTLVKSRDRKEIEYKIFFETTIHTLKTLNKKEQALTAAIHVIMDYVINYKRVNAVVKRVCMFAKKTHTKQEGQNLAIIYPFKLLPTGNIDSKVIKDYKEHYTEIDEFIEWLVAARFASDRKNAFLYFLASSNWGKGLLFSGILKDKLGLVTEIKESDLIKVNKSEPVGISPEDFLNSWVLLINELAFLPRECKQLENQIKLRPLYTGKTEADVYAKIFCNASDMDLHEFTSISGLSGELKNRFTFLEYETAITNRTLFVSNKTHYINSLANYISDKINKQVRIYRKLKEAEATLLADKSLEAFKKKHCITDKYSGENSQTLANEFKQWLIDNNLHEHHKENLFIITQATRKYELFIEDTYAKCEKNQYMNKRNEIVKLASAGCAGVKSIKHKGKSCRGFLINKEEYLEQDSKIINADF